MKLLRQWREGPEYKYEVKIIKTKLHLTTMIPTDTERIKSDVVKHDDIKEIIIRNILK